jgi:Fe-S-cluster-containing hydrogenase component 2
MKANYGYTDGSGEFYITIDTDLCVRCTEHWCVDACPVGSFEIIVDDYDDEVAAIKETHRKKIKYDCAPCKPVSGRPPLPCVQACTLCAITHSW